jgi:hypothetical protein
MGLLLPFGWQWRLGPAERARAASPTNELVVDGGDALRLVPDDTFLYSVFDVTDSDPGYLIYRARLADEDGAAGFQPSFGSSPSTSFPSTP